MIFRCVDLETDSTDPATCVVVQAAIVEAPASASGIDLAAASARSMLFHAASIPAGAQRVHGITTEMVADAPPFSRAVRSIVQQLTQPGVVAVTYNGRKYDIPIIARYATAIFQDAVATPAMVEAMFISRHIDVLRLWLRVRSMRVTATWLSSTQPFGDDEHVGWPWLTADMFAGTLTAAYAFYFGRGFEGAHAASIDCRSTLAVLDAMLRNGDVPDVETAIRWSNAPLPGDVDIDGKFVWDGDRCVITFGKYKGSPIEQVDTGFLAWMLRQDFAADTKAVVRKFLSGEYPQCEGEVTHA